MDIDATHEYKGGGAESGWAGPEKLISACRKGHKEEALLQLELFKQETHNNGPDVLNTEVDGETALVLAINSNMGAVAEDLLAMGARGDKGRLQGSYGGGTSLLLACERNMPSLVTKLLDQTDSQKRFILQELSLSGLKTLEMENTLLCWRQLTRICRETAGAN